jgi:hypothetical protein
MAAHVIDFASVLPIATGAILIRLVYYYFYTAARSFALLTGFFLKYVKFVGYSRDASL